jgi:hypothetical protein
MKTYHVVWEIDLDAESPRDAALEARKVHQDPGFASGRLRRLRRGRRSEAGGSGRARVKKLALRPDPCSSCPYRRDTPSGVWGAEEYLKLPAYDEFMGGAGTFLCHHSPVTGCDTVCRGWLEVQHGNLFARIAAHRVEVNKENENPTKVPLYSSGAEACRAGLRGVRRPGKKAQTVIQKLVKARRGSSRQA